MKRLRIVLLLVLAGCASQGPVASAVTELDVAFGQADKYSSVDGVFHRSMCRADDIAERVPLSPAQLRAIGDAAQAQGFFDLPAYLHGPGMEPTQDTIRAVAPCPMTRLRIRHDGRENDVEWSCDSDGGRTPPAQVAVVYRMVHDAIYASKALADLPRGDCRYH